MRGDEEMKPNYNKPKHPERTQSEKENMFDYCLRKGLIEKTPYGYYFKPEFFETLSIYDFDEDYDEE
jgi:hypothetical protein